MLVYRISKNKYANDLSGVGAKLTGGRWNKKGTAILYTSASASLCLLEVLVHIPMSFMPKSMVLSTIELPKKVSIKTYTVTDLPENWNSDPGPSRIQYYTKSWIEKGEFLVLKVPNAIITQEWNYLINPLHKDFVKVRLVNTMRFPVDARLVK